jgi:hypothetical protein
MAVYLLLVWLIYNLYPLFLYNREICLQIHNFGFYFKFLDLNILVIWYISNDVAYDLMM